MARRSRLGLIKKLEALRNSRVVVYVTGDRQGMEAKIASDVFPFILEHLESIGETDRIDLFLYTPGGLSNAGTGLVALFREFCTTFGVLIPFKAQSAGTLIALGADTIVMTKLSQLSPVDPSVQSPYNPTAPGPQPPVGANLLPVNVEEVVGYLSLAREEAQIKDDDAMARVFGDLSSKVHPLALGSVYRAKAQIEMLATRLLRRHMGEGNSDKVSEIVQKLTRDLYSHDYIIGRTEAKDVLGLNVEDVDEETEATIWKLYKSYESLMELTVPMTPAVVLGDQDEVRRTFTQGVIESRLRTDAFQTDQSFKRLMVTPPGAPAPVEAFQGKLFSQRWITNAKV